MLRWNSVLMNSTETAFTADNSHWCWGWNSQILECVPFRENSGNHITNPITYQILSLQPHILLTYNFFLQISVTMQRNRSLVTRTNSNPMRLLHHAKKQWWSRMNSNSRRLLNIWSNLFCTCYSYIRSKRHILTWFLFYFTKFLIN